MKVVNIIPTYNEKENIKEMIKTLQNIAKKNKKWDFETLIVDDNSPDGTAKIVEKLMKKNTSLHLLNGPKKGLGTALLRGFSYAIKKLKADVVVTNDCDFSWDPQKIPNLLEKIEKGWDVVIASRYNSKGRAQTKGWNRLRKINHWIANIFFAAWIAQIKQVKDHNGNFKAIRVKGVLDQVPIKRLLKSLKVKGFAIQPYLIYQLSKTTDKFLEVFVPFKFRLKGEAKVSRKYFKTYSHDAVEYAKLCLHIGIKRFFS
jgi:dolichol-phosphate mannosyltransferase